MHVLLVYGGDLKVMEEPTTDAALGKSQEAKQTHLQTHFRPSMNAARGFCARAVT